MQPKWRSTIGCRKCAEHPDEGLAKFGYKSDMKYKPLNNFLYLWLNSEKPDIKIWYLLLSFFLSFLRIEN
jgi:hypothetical protein